MVIPFKLQKNVRHHLLTILGLAQSNSRAENTLFTARHSLVACKLHGLNINILIIRIWLTCIKGGWVLRHHSDQEAAESLLRDMHARTGWNMDGLIQSLREQWRDEADINE